MSTPNPTGGPTGPSQLALETYLADRDRRHTAAIGRVLGALEPRELAVVREAAVMGYVRGTFAAGQPVPPDSHVLAHVVGQCMEFPDLYPVLAALSAHIGPQSPREHVAAQLVTVHSPRCQGCGGPPGQCSCTAPVVCGTCTSVGLDHAERPPSPWPCATLTILGRVAVCANTVEAPDLTATPCPGYLVFAPTDAQARCLTCGAWCGSQVADYVETTDPDPGC